MPELTHYQRNLPHRLPPGESIFITYRLAGSLPRTVVEQLQAELEHAQQHAPPDEHYALRKRYFSRFDNCLDTATVGPTWLRHPLVADLVKKAFHHYDGRAYQLVCYCLMANHVHLVVTLPDDAPLLARTLQKIKSYTALEANKLLGRTGQFWQRESYDHIVRNPDEMQRIIRHVVENPVKAGLTNDWQCWPHTYLL